MFGINITEIYYSRSSYPTTIQAVPILLLPKKSKDIFTAVAYSWLLSCRSSRLHFIRKFANLGTTFHDALCHGPVCPWRRGITKFFIAQSLVPRDFEIDCRVFILTHPLCMKLYINLRRIGRTAAEDPINTISLSCPEKALLRFRWNAC